MIIVSACLAGVHCRYDGGEKACQQVLRLVAEGNAIPLCPEQLGGLTTPRQPCEISAGRVITRDGTDLTEAFQHGAHEALKIARMVGAKTAILKANSPSCGSGIVYDGSFSGKLVPGDGVFAALCKTSGLLVKTEQELE